MALTPGVRLGPFEVVSSLGAGGMGEVYRARDTKLQRDVAVKVLPEHLANDRDRLARFEREAQVLASLNHPHIAQIYGLEESGATRALVLELVEGDTLADRIARGALPLDEALPIAMQIAEALDAAHGQGIIHRDLKPANIKVTAAGVVKVLDFGLAKLADTAAGPSGLSSHSISPTLTSPAMTGVGMVLGTAAYMAPEQAKGRPTDKRSDMWAFGAVLYEMLTGSRAFDGEDVSDTMAAVLRAEPDWSRLPKTLPPALRTLLQRCLEKDRGRRVVDAGAALFVLGELSGPAPDVAPSIDTRPPPSRRWLLGGGAAVIISAALGAAAMLATLRPAPPRVVRFDVTPPPDAPLTVGPAGLNLAVSPDGTKILYHARHGSVTTLDIRSLDTGESLSLSQTDGAMHPAFSPDGSKLAFFKAGKLYTLSINARVLTALADVADATGLNWGAADAIVYTRPGPKGGLFRVSPGGGAPVVIASPNTKTGEQDYLSPQLLADGATAIFVVRSTSGSTSRLSIAARAIASGEQKIVVESGVSPQYSRAGYLLYVQGSVLNAARFDPGQLATVGPALPVVNGIISKGATANYGLSDDGTLTYIPGSTINYVSRFIWKGRDGKLAGPAGPPALEYPRYPRLSPDGRRFAATVGPAQEGHVWVYDVSGAAQPYKVTFSAHNTSPAWTPDGTRIGFVTTRDGPTRNLFIVPADGSAVEPTRLVTSDKDKTNFAWGPDEVLMYQQLGDSTRMDLWTQIAGKQAPWLQTQFAEYNPVFSPDGKWVAFVWDRTSVDEIWVLPFPGPGPPKRVSSAGGHDPVWSRDGKELFYQEGAKLMGAKMIATAPLEFQTPQIIFDGGFVMWEPNSPRTYDVAEDGRFLMIEPSATYSQRFNIVLNWTEELKRLVPAK